MNTTAYLLKFQRSIILLLSIYPIISVAGNFAYIPSSVENKIFVIDTRTDRVVQTITSPKPGAQGSFGIAVSSLDNRLVLTQSPQGEDSISYVSSVNMQPPFSSDILAKPTASVGISINKSHSIVYFVNQVDGSIGKFSLPSASNFSPDVETLNIALASPFGIARIEGNIVAEGPRLLVTETVSNSLAVISETTESLIGRIDVGVMPKGLATSPDGRYAYVVNSGEDSVSIVDLVRLRSLYSIGVGSQPFAVALHPQTKRLYVTCQGAAPNYEGSVSIVDLVSRSEIKRLKVGRQPSGISIDPTRMKVYVANSGSDNVSVIDIKKITPVVKKTVKVGKVPVAFGDFVLTGVPDMPVSFENEVIAFGTQNSIGWGELSKGKKNHQDYQVIIKHHWGFWERHIRPIKDKEERIWDTVTGVATLASGNSVPKIYFSGCKGDRGRLWLVSPQMVNEPITFASVDKESPNFCFNAISIDPKTQKHVYIGTAGAKKNAVFKCTFGSSFDACTKVADSDSPVTGVAFFGGSGYSTSEKGIVYQYRNDQLIATYRLPSDKNSTFNLRQNLAYNGERALAVPIWNYGSWESKYGSELFEIRDGQGPISLTKWEQDRSNHLVAMDTCGNRLIYNSGLEPIEDGGVLIRSPGLDAISDFAYYGRVYGFGELGRQLSVVGFAMSCRN